LKSPGTGDGDFGVRTGDCGVGDGDQGPETGDCGMRIEGVGELLTPQTAESPNARPCLC